jgi:hypothetical protein
MNVPSGPARNAGKKMRFETKEAVNKDKVRIPKRKVGTNELKANTARPKPITPQLCNIARPHVS